MFLELFLGSWLLILFVISFISFADTLLNVEVVLSGYLTMTFGAKKHRPSQPVSIRSAEMGDAFIRARIF